MWDVIVGGGGPAGMACALEAARQGLSVLLLEKNKKLGVKLLLTGAGRCNLLNEEAKKEDFPQGSELVSRVLDQWPSEKLADYFRQMGLSLSSRGDKRIFPKTDRAQSVVDLLSLALREANVTIQCGERIEMVVKKGSNFVVTTAKESHQSKIFVLAFGGRSHPRTGSSGEGYELLKAFGHTIVPPRPALVPLKAKLGPFHKLQGQKWRCGLSLFDGQQELCSSIGDVMWTNYGLSGLAILDITAKAALADYEGLRISLSLFPEIEDLSTFLCQRAKEHGDRTFNEFFVGLLPKKMTKVCLPLALTESQMKTPVKDLDEALIDKVAVKLSSLSMTLTGFTGWEQAQVTAGGAELTAIELDSCQSKVVKGLYVIGEVLDAHGLSGGYNLHLAWATALMASRAIASD